jgi:FHA domain-containing protein
LGALETVAKDDSGMPPIRDSARTGALALLEILDRDDHVRQQFPVREWPLHVGRALDNDVILTDPNIAAHHLTVDTGEQGLVLTVAPETRNGVLLGRRRLRAGETAALATGTCTDDAIELIVGRTRMRLRLAEHALAPELHIAPAVSFARRVVPMLVAAFVVVFGVLFTAFLGTDPEALARAAGTMLMSMMVGAAVWCGAWALLSKTFTRQAHFGWHVRVFLFAGVALMAIATLPSLLAFSLSWPWLTDFAFIGEIAVAATALYFHLLAVEPARSHLLKWVAATCALVGVSLSLWFNVQRTDMLGDELYMSHLFPPVFRLARPIATDKFIDGLAPLKASLDKKAKEPDNGEDSATPEEE